VTRCPARRHSYRARAYARAAESAGLDAPETPVRFVTMTGVIYASAYRSANEGFAWMIVVLTAHPRPATFDQIDGYSQLYTIAA
jgi:hypothetical protein